MVLFLWNPPKKEKSFCFIYGPANVSSFNKKKWYNKHTKSSNFFSFPINQRL